MRKQPPRNDAFQGIMIIAVLTALLMTAVPITGSVPSAPSAWFHHNGTNYRVGEAANSSTRVARLSIETADGRQPALSETDRRGLIWAYEMSRSPHLQPARAADLANTIQDIKAYLKTDLEPGFFSVFQKKLATPGGILTAAFLGSPSGSLALFSKEALKGLRHLIVTSPERAAHEWARATLKDGKKRMERLKAFVERIGQTGIGRSPDKPFDIGEVWRRYQDAVMVDAYWEPAADLAQATRTAPGFREQGKSVLQVLAGGTATAIPGNTAIQSLLDTGEFVRALTTGVPAFNTFRNDVEARLTVWDGEPAGRGKQAPPAFAPGSGAASSVIAQTREDNLDTATAREILPYAELALAMYAVPPSPPKGWTVLETPISLGDRVGYHASGFHAGAFRGPDRRVVIAFEGTSPPNKTTMGFLKDLIADVSHVVVVPKQYKQAVGYVEQVMHRHGLNGVLLTGHSLGGGLAQYAGGMLGQPAVTFNHAGLWYPTFKRVLKAGSGQTADMIHVVTQGFVFDDQLVVNSRQDTVSTLGIHLGRLLRVPITSPAGLTGEKYRHNMERLRDAVRAIAMVPTPIDSEMQTIIAVVDSSGSMRQTDASDLRIAAMEMMISSLDQSVSLGLVDFDSRASILTPPLPLGPFGGNQRQKFQSLARQVDARGGTDIRAGLSTAARLVPADQPAAVVLLTDGHDRHAYRGKPDFFPDNVPIHTIALSEQADQKGLAQLSTDTGGIPEIARTAGDLQRIISALFGEAAGQEVLLVSEGSIKQGEERVFEVYVDNGHELVSFQVSWMGSDIDLVLEDPAGRRYDIAKAERSGHGVEAATYDLIQMANPIPGKWVVRLLGIRLPAAGEHFDLRVSGNRSAHRTRWKVNMPVPEVGLPLTVDLMSRGDLRWHRSQVKTWAPGESAQVRKQDLDGTLSALGGGSGLNMLQLIPARPGLLRVQITANGQTAEGVKIQRCFDRSFRVAAPGQGKRYRQDIDPFIRRTPIRLR